MKTYQLSAVIAAAAFAGTATFAQTTATPAAAPDTAVVAPAPQNQAPLAINGYVYVDKLPTPTQLMSEAEAEQLTITRMDQSAGRIVAVYQYPDGRTRAFAYTTAAPANGAPMAAATSLNTSSATYTMVAPPPTQTTVVYTDAAPRVIYYDSPRYVRYYDPAWDFWAPLAVGVGLGWTFGGHGGGHGGYHGHGGHHR